ncbi:hypothetical protein BpHYR1_039961 [Brachionus plicatilis]|uniref:Uncharacterized protein n=1 Tax=Brachionus plicatilis TaxID=10195 RepID=A0A3M7RKK8_BRAPC|nr:hypothetical protein BpHYR1_039961 [Brachionus plicatilis]
MKITKIRIFRLIQIVRVPEGTIENPCRISCCGYEQECRLIESMIKIPYISLLHYTLLHPYLTVLKLSNVHAYYEEEFIIIKQVLYELYLLLGYALDLVKDIYKYRNYPQKIFALFHKFYNTY